jgi:hypothetical protein
MKNRIAAVNEEEAADEQILRLLAMLKNQRFALKLTRPMNVRSRKNTRFRRVGDAEWARGRQMNLALFAAQKSKGAIETCERSLASLQLVAAI